MKLRGAYVTSDVKNLYIQIHSLIGGDGYTATNGIDTHCIDRKVSS